MKIIVETHKLALDKTPVNEKEINITKCEFEFADEITNDYVKEAYFTLNGNSYKQLIVNNECDIPSEVLEEKGQIELGVVAYLVENETEIKRYNPSPTYFDTWKGSLKDAENTEPITPTDKEQIMQALNNMNIDGNKVGKITTITISYKDGTTKTLTLEDGMGLEYNWVGPSLGIKREDEVNYEYVDLKGDKGEPGAIKMVIVNQLPSTGAEDTIYLVPLATPESQENNYAEYIYINGNWELLGKIGIQVDLTDYALKSEIPTQLSQLTDDSTHRLVSDTEKTTWSNKSDFSGNYNDLSNKPDLSAKLDVSQVKNDNSTTAGDVYDVRYINSLIGDIASALDLINNEVI